MLEGQALSLQCNFQGVVAILLYGAHKVSKTVLSQSSRNYLRLFSDVHALLLRKLEWAAKKRAF